MNPVLNIFHPDLITTLYFVSALVIPFLSSLLARAHWDSFWVGAITGLLSAVNGVVTTWQASDNAHTFQWETAFSAALFSWATSVIITRSGLLRATGVDAKLLAFPQPRKAAAVHEQQAA